nr:hypothetical protein [Candidatus Sigynarchaeota archaeon]
GWTSFVNLAPVLAWLIYAGIGFVIATWWCVSILRIVGRVDQFTEAGSWARGLQIVTRSFVKTSFILVECINFDDDPETRAAILKAMDDW